LAKNSERKGAEEQRRKAECGEGIDPQIAQITQIFFVSWPPLSLAKNSERKGAEEQRRKAE
jgi:hypothetical protein